MKYDLNHFPGLILKGGLFFAWPLSLRFDLSCMHGSLDFIPREEIPVDPDGTVDLLALGEIIDEHESEIRPEVRLHLTEAIRRAEALLGEIFSGEDLCLVAAQGVRQGLTEDIPVLQDCGLALASEIELADYPYDPEDFDEDYPWTRTWMTAKWDDLDLRTLISLIAYRDYSGLGAAISSEIYIIKPSEHLICYMYDDRGCDILTTQAVTLRPLYHKYSAWLHYDEDCRAQMAEAFEE